MKYTKLFSTIVDSTIWQESLEIKALWITMLAKADWHGYVYASVPGLASATGIKTQDCADALIKLASPDQWSRSKEHEGRRIEETDGGWLILNYEKYRDILSEEYRRSRDRDRQNKRRKKLSHKKCDSHEKSRHIDLDLDLDKDKATRKDLPSKKRAVLLNPTSDPNLLIESARKRAGGRVIKYSDGFQKWWSSYPKRIGKAAAYKVWMAMEPNFPALDDMISTLLLQSKTYQWTKDGGQFVPHPRTYLNQGRWDDVVTEIDLRRPETPQERKLREDEESYQQRLEEARERDLARSHDRTRDNSNEWTDNNAGDSLFGSCVSREDIEQPRNRTGLG